MLTSTGTVIIASELVAVCEGVTVIDGSLRFSGTGARRSESSCSGDSASSTARSITLRSSRTLPGQSCFIIRSIVSCAIDEVSPPGVVARMCSISSGRSSLRSRLGDQLLARTGLAGVEHGRIALRQLLEPREQLAHLDRAADHRAVAIGIRELDLDRFAERLELHPRRAHRDLRAGHDVDVVDAQAGDVRAVRRVEIAQAVAAIVEATLRVQAGDLAVGQLDIVTAASAA